MKTKTKKPITQRLYACFLQQTFAVLTTLFLLLALTPEANAQTRGASMPYTRYESEVATRGGSAALQGSSYATTVTACEASDRKYVSLPSSGSYVQWTVSGSSQNGFTLRYTVPDNTTGTLALYVNNTKIRDITLSSYWAWQYFNISPSTDGIPTNSNPGGTYEPRMRFDELHFVLPSTLSTGAVIKLQKDNNDGNAYGIDFIELETVPAAIAKPTGFLSITDYGATPNDETNDQAAFRTCLDLCASNPSYLGVYIPAGRFINSQGGSTNGNLYVANSNIAIQGAGMWYTEIYFGTTNSNSSGFLFNANNIDVKDFYMNGATNGRIAGNKAMNGSLGAGSTITNVWAEHFETGFWITSMVASPWNITTGLIISNCRIRNVYADGVNLCKGTSTTIVDNCSFRNCIDDAMATWSVNYLEAVPPTPCNGNIFRNSTVENNLRAGGLGFFGGHSHQAYNLLIKDGLGSGVRANTQFPAYPFGTSQAQAINIHDITIIGCGTTKNLWTYRDGAIDLELPTVSAPGAQYSLQYINFNNIDIIDSQHDAIFIHSYMTTANSYVLDNIVFTNTNINGTGTALSVNNGPLYTTGTGEKGGYGIYVANYNPTVKNFVGQVNYTGNFSNISTNAANTALYQTNGYFTLNVTISNPAPVTGVTVSPTTLSLAAGATAPLTATVLPSNAGNKNVTWSSLNAAIATVSSTGLVTAVAPGTATIRVTTVEGGFTANCTVTVTPAVNITATDAAAGEGGNVGVFTISVGSISSNITVGYTRTGTAATTDFTPALSGTVTLTPSAPSATITITPVDDALFESSETVILTLNAGAGYNLGGNTVATVTIADNDNPPCTSPVIALTATAPVIDQSIDAAWSIAPVMNINNATIGSRPADYNGTWKAMYNSTNLYILVQVSDATKFNDSGTSWWEDDVIEIFIDGNNSKGATYDGVDDFQLGFRYNDAAINIGGTSVTRTTGIQFAIQNVTGGYNLEMVIPWSTIGTTASIGKMLGFEVEIDDDDNGGTRDTQMSAFATTTTAWSTPSVFGTVYLTTCGTTVPVTSVSVSPTSASVAVGATTQLTATVLPANATDKSVTWSSSNTAIATVNTNGLVTGVSAGAATITVRTNNGGFTATSAITVTTTTVPVTGVTVSPTSASVTVGATQQLTATVLPANATNKTVTWTSSNSAIASVNASGLVTGVAAGSATITVTTQSGGFTATSAITVTTTTIPVTGVTVSPISASLTVGATQQLTATVLPANATNKTVTWTTNNSAIASVNASGLVTGVAAGSATITVTTQSGGFTATSAITVTGGGTLPSPWATSDIGSVAATGSAGHSSGTYTIAGSGADIWGTADEFRYVYQPITGDVTITARLASMTNTNAWAKAGVMIRNGLGANVAHATMVVTPTSGVSFQRRTTAVGTSTETTTTGITAPRWVRLQRVGSTITAYQSANGTTWTTVGSQPITMSMVYVGMAVTSHADGTLCTAVFDNVTVTTGNVPVTGVTLSPTSASIGVGATQQLTATVLPSNATNKTVTWTSSNSAIATVNTSGLVTGVSAGSATITVTTQSGGFTATSAITVTGTTLTYYRIKNRWQNTYLTDGGANVAYSTLPGTPGLIYEWIREDVGGGQFELRNASTNEYMHIENQTGFIQCTARTSGWASSRWTTETTDNGFVRLRNIWQPTQYIHIENLNGFAQHGTINAAWMSAQWIFEAVPKSAGEVIISEPLADVTYMPNPVMNELNIHFNGNSFSQVSVYDVTGKLLYSETINTDQSSILLEMNSMKSGVYIIRLSGNLNSQVFRIIKN